MIRNVCITLAAISAGLSINTACDSKKDPAARGRQAVEETVTQPFKTLEGAKDSLEESANKTKTALERLEKESKP